MSRGLLRRISVVGALLGALSLTPIAGGAANEKAECATAAETAEKLRDEKHFAKAREGLLRCSRESCPKVVRSDCLKSLAELDQGQPTVVLRARDAEGRDVLDAEVTVDGVALGRRLDGKAVPLDPGAHELALDASGSGFVAHRGTLVVSEGEKNRVVTISLVRASTPAPSSSAPAVVPSLPRPASTSSSIAPWIAGGIGVAGLAAFGALQLTAHSRYAELRDSCGQTSTCASSDVGAVRTKLVLSGVALGVGAVGLVTSAVLFGISPRDSVGASTDREGTSLLWRRRFLAARSRNQGAEHLPFTNPTLWSRPLTISWTLLCQIRARKRAASRTRGRLLNST